MLHYPGHETFHSQADIYMDFDGTFTLAHSHYKLHLLGIELGPSWKYGIGAWYGLKTIGKDRLGLDNSDDLEKLGRVLKGLPFESAWEQLAPAMILNPKLETLCEELGEDHLDICLLTKNDHRIAIRTAAIHNLTLQSYGISVVGCIANHYPLSDGIFTGEANIYVAGNKHKYFQDKPFFADQQDQWRYGDRVVLWDS